LGLKRKVSGASGIKLVDEPTTTQSKITESNCLENKGLILDVLRFKENHGVYKHLIESKKEFVEDMNSWYPGYSIEDITFVVEMLQKNGWRDETATPA
jgi:hypothetical protein